MLLQVQDVSYKTVLHNISTVWTKGMVGMIGPNGAGKSTLLRLIAGIERPDRGDILLDGNSISHMTTRERARRIAYLPQQLPDDVIFTVQEFVEMGRYAHRGSFGTLTKECRISVDSALERMNLQGLAQLPLGQLSGGERQRVGIARCLAQETQVLVLDEPISNLDLFYQIDLLKQLAKLANEGYLVLLAIHHLELAAQFCDELVMLHEGQVFQSGPPVEVLQSDFVKEVFKMDVRVFEDPFDASLRLSFAESAAPGEER